MRDQSFAEILKEKIKNTQNAQGNPSFQPSYTNENAQHRPSSSNHDLAQLQTGLFMHSPHIYRNSKPTGLKQTPYNQGNQKAQRQENQARGHFKGAHESFTQNHSSTLGQSSAPHQKPSKTQAPAPRARSVAHKLNDKQTKSMSYFISEKIFLLDDFTWDELKKAYRRLALVKHPDKQNGSIESFIELKKHFETLSAVPKK